MTTFWEGSQSWTISSRSSATSSEIRCAQSCERDLLYIKGKGLITRREFEALPEVRGGTSTPGKPFPLSTQQVGLDQASDREQFPNKQYGELLRRTLNLLDTLTANEIKGTFRNLAEFKG